MNFDPQKFFIGVVDLFSMLLPGAAVAYLAWQWEFVRDLSPFEIRSGPEGWLVFFFASYLIGHFLFSAGAVLDDIAYQPLTAVTEIGHINRLADGKWVPWPIVRWMVGLLLGKTDDKALMQAVRLKKLALGPAAKGVNAFQWSKARLSKVHPPSLVAVERFEADSKFFRSLIFPLIVAMPILACRQPWWQTAACVFLFGFAFWRYLHQRRKATQQAYWSVIALDEVKDAGKAAEPRADEPSHGGGVVYRKRGKAIEYLVIQAERKRSEWVLPKGHIEPGEHPRETAVREVKEETGHWARIIGALGNYSLDETAPLVRFYLMKLEVADTMKPQMRRARDRREEKWLELDDAARQLSHDKSRTIVRNANALRIGGQPGAEPRRIASRHPAEKGAADV